MSNFIYLQNQFLIATPGIEDPDYHKTVIYICEHDAQGAMGLIINQPMTITINDLLKHMQIMDTDKNEENLPAIFQQTILMGGPLQRERGFVLHHPIGKWQSSLVINDEMAITTSRDILEVLAKDQGPEQVVVALGYTGWDAGQLEEELSQNDWLTCPLNKDIIFNIPAEQRWQAAGHLLGIDLLSLPSGYGHA